MLASVNHWSGRAAITLLTFMLASAAQLLHAKDVPQKFWMPLQSNTVGWQSGQQQPIANGVISDKEYANGIKIDLNDFSNTVKNGNGRLYLNLSDNVAFTSNECRHFTVPEEQCVGGTLHIGLQVHGRQSPDDQGEDGKIRIFIDVPRQQSLDEESCTGTAGEPTAMLNTEDRQIELSYKEFSGANKVDLTVNQFQGSCTSGWQDITPTVFANNPRAWTVEAAAMRSAATDTTPAFLTFELAITAQPNGDKPLTSQIVKEQLFGLGVWHSTHSPYGSFGHFPSVYNKPPAPDDTWSWATIDLKSRPRINLSMTAYNVGQLQISDDGGQGEYEDFAALTYASDVVCLTEEMTEDERDDVTKAINLNRRVNGMGLLTPVYPGDGSPPNNMLLVSGPIIASEFVLFGDLPGVTTYCADEVDLNPIDGGECLGFPATGYKGIIWARVGIKKSAAGGKPPKPQSWFSDEFIDIFCTHTQADYRYDGQFATPQWCNDTIFSPAVGANREKTASAPSENPWLVNVREEQWDALKTWSHAKRAGGNGLPNGLDRPAFLLGDLNQIGPKGVSRSHANADIMAWVETTKSALGFGTLYKEMREKLGNWSLSPFDQANGWGWDLYDLMARDINGTWIGQGTESNVTDTLANNCIPGKVMPPPPPEESVSIYYPVDLLLPKEARVDYIMVLPAEGGFPYYTITGPDSNPAEPVVAVNANVGDWHDGYGCASDHAQVTATIGLVQTGVKANYNPTKTHKLTYWVSHLWDIHDADGEDTDWYVPSQGFKVVRRDSNNVDIETVYKSFSDDDTPDGVAVPVDWSGSVTVKPGETVRAGVSIWDYDWPSDNDQYDGTSFEYASNPPPIFAEPFFEFDHAYPGTFSYTGGLSFLGTMPLGTVDPSASDIGGSCRLGCSGVETYGNGDLDDNDVKVTQSLLLEEVD